MAYDPSTGYNDLSDVSDEELDRQLAAHGLIPSAPATSQAVAPAPVAAPAFTIPTSGTVPLNSAGIGQVGDSQYAPPVAPTVPSTANASVPSTITNRLGIPGRDASPASTASASKIPGLDTTATDPSSVAALSGLIDGGQPAPTIPGLDSVASAPAPSQQQSPAVFAVSPTAPGHTKAVQPFTGQDAPYRVDDSGNLSFDPSRLAAGLIAANGDGLIPDDKLKELLPQAVDAQKAAQAQQGTVNDLQAKVASAGDYAPAKAATFGAAKAAGFLAAAGPGSGVGAEVGSLLGPFGAGAGAIIGGLITGTLGSMTVDKTARALAQHSDTIKSFTDSSDLHPYYDAAGNLLAFGAGIPRALTGAAGSALAAEDVTARTVGQTIAEQSKAAAAAGDGTTASLDLGKAAQAVFSPSNLRQAAAQGLASGGGGLASTVSNFADEAATRAASGETAASIAKNIGFRVGANSLGMVAIDTAIKEGSKALGFSNQGQTLGGAAQAAVIGAFMSGHGITAQGATSDDIAQAVNAVKLRQNVGVSLDAPLTPEQVPSDMDAATYNAVKEPVTPRQMILVGAFEDRVNQMVADGTIPAPKGYEDLAALAQAATGKEAFVHGQRVATAVKIDPSALPDAGGSTAPRSGPGVASASPALTDRPSPATPATPADPAAHLEKSSQPVQQASDAPPAPVPPASPVVLGATSSASIPSIPSAPAGQAPTGQSAPQPDDKKGVGSTDTPATDPALAAMVQTRDGFQALLDGGKIAPEAREATQAQVDSLSRQIAAASGQSPSSAPVLPGANPPTPKAPSAPAPTPLARATPDAAPQGASGDVDSSAAIGTQPTPGTPSGSTKVAPSGQDTAPAARDKYDEPDPIDPHQALADAVNNGASADHPTGPPSSAFDVLRRVRAQGVDVTPDLARTVSEQSQEILEDSGISDETKQAQLAQLVRDHAPADLAAPAEPSPVVAPRQPGDSDKYATARQWIADQRAAGSAPTVSDVVAKQRISPATSRQLLADQDAAEAAAQPTAATDATPTTTRQPVTPEGQRAQKIVDSLTAKQSAQNGFLSPDDHGTLARQRETVDRDLNEQVLGQNPYPVSEAGKASAQAIQSLQEAQDAGAQLTPGQHAAWRNHRAILHNDFTRQRQAFDEQPATQGVAQAPSASTGKPPAATTAKPITVSPQPGDSPGVALAREWVGEQRAAGKQPKARDVQQAAKIGLEQAHRVLNAQARAEASQSPAAPVATPPAPATPAPAASAPGKTSASTPPATFKAKEKTMYQGRRATVESVTGNKANILVHAETNLLARRVRNVPLSKLEKLSPGSSKPITQTGALVTARKIVAANSPMLKRLGVKRVVYGPTKGGSGVEFAPDGTLHIAPTKVAASMETVRANQAAGTPGTPEDWFTQVLHHESFHGVGNEVAKARGFVDAKGDADPAAFYNSLPDDALPPDMDEKGRASYGKGWDGLPTWAKKAEFIRMFLEGKYTGRITEALYKFIRPIVDYFRQMAAGEGVDPRFKEFVQPFEQRIEKAFAGEGAASEPSVPFARPSRAVEASQSKLVRSLEAAANGNPGNAAVVSRYQDAAKQLAEIQRQRAMLLQPGETPRSFKMPSATTGGADVLDHIVENGGIVSPKDAQAKPTYDPRTGDYDAAPTLGGFYHHAVYKSGGGMMPDQMAETLHENYGVGDGTPDGMWKAISQAVDLRRKVAAQQRDHAAAERQASNFGKDALAPDTAKGTVEVNTSNLNVGAKVQVGDQTLTVAAVDPDTLDVTLEDHSRYGVQQVADGTALYVEKVTPAPNDSTLAAARPDQQTGDLFGDDEPFSLRGQPGSELERVAAAREVAQRAAEPAATPSTAPTLRPGEKGTGDLFQSADQPFNLAGGTAIDHGARQAAQEQAEREAAEAKEKQAREQQSLDFTTPPASEPKVGTAPVKTSVQPPAEEAPAGGSDTDTLAAAEPEPADAKQRIVALRQPGDTDRQAAAREWLADQRAAGKNPTPREVTRARQLMPETAKRLLADQDAAERQARNPDTLAAATPEPVYAGLVDGAKAKLEAAKQAVGDTLARSRADDEISKSFDAVPTIAGMNGRQVGNSVRLDFPDAMDRQAASAVVEAGGQRPQLEADLAKVQGSADPKLATKYAPVYRHALDNLPRLQAATANHNAIEADQLSQAVRAGVPVEERERYVAHAFSPLERPDGTTAPISGPIGAAPGRGKSTLADAIAAGRDPGTMDLGDLTQRRVTRNQQLIGERSFHNELAGMKASDGKTVLSAISENTSDLNPDGSVTSMLKVPRDYEAVQAGDNVLTVHKEFAPILKALYGTSALRGDNWQGRLGNALLNAVAFAKHGTVGVGDTYHLMRVITKEVTGFQTFGYGKGMAAQEYADADLDRAVKAGEISQPEADFARASRPVLDKLLKAGLNTGKVADNLLEAAKQHGLIARVPILGPLNTRLNDFIFHTYQRGAMTQAAVVAYNRNRARFPELSDEEVARRSAREVNEFFGNLQNQGFIKSKTMQDVARLTLFSPQWTESQARAEARGFAQAAKAPVDAVRGKGFRVGVVAQAMGGAVLAALVANQALNLFTRGKPTWENPEDGHKWDAWIPGGQHGRGFFFSPLSIAAEYSHALLRYMHGGDSALDAAAKVGSNKLSGLARAAKDLATGTDYKGQPYASTGERFTAAATDALPLPVPLGPLIEKDPKAPLGYGLNHQKGALEKQLLAMAGLKVDPADSARSQMYALGQQYRAPQAQSRPMVASAYADLRRALGNEDTDGARAEILRLATEGGKTLTEIADKGAGIRDRQVHPELFTGSVARDKAMIAQMTPAQHQTYLQAFRDRQADAAFLSHVVSTMPPDQRRQLELASAANARGNRGLSATMGRTSSTAPASTVPTMKSASPTVVSSPKLSQFAGF